jgi:hypothetical protein
MTSRHTREEPRWGWAPVVSAGYEPAGTGGHSAASAPIPESLGLPPSLERGLRLLIDGADSTVTYTVRPEPEAVTAARRFTTTMLGNWGMGMLTDDVALVVTELVTNALRHSIPSHPHFLPPGSPRRRPAAPTAMLPTASHTASPTPGYDGVIRLRLLHAEIHRTPWLLAGILDGGREAPRRKEPDYIAETGRGLHLVDSFTHCWGWRGLAGGKVVWALFRHP